MDVHFTVLGAPKGKARPRFDTRSGRAYTPKETVNYETLVRTEYVYQTKGFKFGDDVALNLEICAYFPIPQSASKKRKAMMKGGEIRPTKKPDMDNIIKIIADSLNGVAYHDDKQIVDCTVQKFYSEKPRVEVSIYEVKKEEE